MFQFKSGNNSIDLNVLKELPKDIQKEIMEEYNLSDTAFDKLENKTASDNTNGNYTF